MRRRRYLATTAALLAGPLAGCAHPNVVMTMTAVDDADVARRASRSVDANPEARAVVAEAVENGSATASGSQRPFDTEQPIAYGGRYYEFSATETGERETTEYSVRIDYEPETPADGNAVAYEDLPDVDRSTVDNLLPPPEDRSPDEGPDFGVARAFSDEELAASVLAPDQEYEAVIFEGTTYPIDVGDGRTVTVFDYRYEAAEIAADAAGFADAIRDQYLFALSGLPDAEREIVAEAVDDGYFEGDVTDAYASLASNFHEHEAFESGEWGGEWLVRWEGTEYWADLQHPSDVVEE